MERSLALRVLASIQGQRMLVPGDRVGVAVSGGADSVALLLLLVDLRKTLGVVLNVVHFNHQLRGKASENDEKFVAQLATKHKLAFHVERLDVSAVAKRDKANLEDAARRSRYAFFAELVGSGQVTCVAVAHTADDQAETVLAHILRGTGLAGLGGIHPVLAGVFRPLLNVRRNELRTYLRSKRQTWREDATNRDTARMRARIRKKLLPLLEKQFQPAAVEHLSTLATLAREDEAFLDGLAREHVRAFVKRTTDSTRISIRDLLEIGKRKNLRERAENTETLKDSCKPLSKRVVRRIVLEMKNATGAKTRLSSGQFTAEHVESVLRLAENAEAGKFLQLPGGIQVRREHEELAFVHADARTRSAKADSDNAFECDIQLGPAGTEICVPVNALGCVFRFRVIDWLVIRGETTSIGSVLDRDTLRFPLVLRNWRPGDRLQTVGHRTARKLKRLLNEKHISRWQRDGWPVLTSNGIVAWARGFPVGHDFAVCERTRTGVLITEERQS